MQEAATIYYGVDRSNRIVMRLENILRRREKKEGWGGNGWEVRYVQQMKQPRIKSKVPMSDKVRSNNAFETLNRYGI